MNIMPNCNSPKALLIFKYAINYYQLSGKKRKTIILNIYINYETRFQFQRYFKLWKCSDVHAKFLSGFVTFISPLHAYHHYSG